MKVETFEEALDIYNRVFEKYVKFVNGAFSIKSFDGSSEIIVDTKEEVISHLNSEIALCQEYALEDYNKKLEEVSQKHI